MRGGRRLESSLMTTIRKFQTGLCSLRRAPFATALAFSALLFAAAPLLGHDLSDESKHIHAHHVTAVWNRISCVEIEVDVKLGDRALEVKMEEAAANRLVTIW